MWVVTEDCCNHYAGAYATEELAKAAVQYYGQGYSYEEVVPHTEIPEHMTQEYQEQEYQEQLRLEAKWASDQEPQEIADWEKELLGITDD